MGDGVVVNNEQRGGGWLGSDAAGWWFAGLIAVLFLWEVVNHENYVAVFALFMP
jgi:hypothetical protein